MKCRFCQNSLNNIFIDLGSSPPSNEFLTKQELSKIEAIYPLKTLICEKCWLVQIDEHKKAKDIFDNKYAYFSSYSKSWLEHSKNYVDMIIESLELNIKSLVMEIASNDGYLLQYFLEKNIPCLGIEPTQNTAQVAINKGINVIQEFFNVQLAEKLSNQKADLIIGNNVLAHVPNINDFVKGLKIVLKHKGTITLEFPHLMRLIELNQFDTIYHEHFSYLSLITVMDIFKFHGLEIFDVEELQTHGGSLRIFAKHLEDNTRTRTDRLKVLEKEEMNRGMQNLNYYQDFHHKISLLKQEILSFLLEAKKSNKKIIGYGAAAKGNTLLNFCGIKQDLLPYVIDASLYKQGKFLPGSRIPVVSEEILKEIQPDYILILPWNLKKEISNQLSYIRNFNSKFVTFIPEIQIF